MANPAPIRILLVEDNVADARLVEAILAETDHGRFVVERADRLSAAHARLAAGGIDVVLLDLSLPDSRGIETFARVAAAAPDMPVIVLTGIDDATVAIRAVERGAQDYLVKGGLDGNVLGRSVLYAIERHRMLAQLQRYTRDLQISEARFRALVQNSSDIIAILDGAGVIRYASPSTEPILGHPAGALRGRHVFELVHPEDAAGVRTFFDAVLGRPGVALTVECRLRHADGSWIHVDAVGDNLLHDPNVGGVVVNARNVTERKRLEAQLHQSQKMDAIGRLAGGIAHDFNNLLTIIIGHSQIQLDRATADAALREDLQVIRETADHAAGLVRQLLVFSRPARAPATVLDLNTVLETTGALLQRVIGEDVELVIIPGRDLGRVLADPGQIEQVILNLTLNARDAMPHGGRLTIETANAELDAEYARRHVGASVGPHVMLAVSDTGAGMDAATQSRIFEPFFTTKAPGKGTGLGLATVYGIVNQSGGTIWVYSESGRGTTFKIYLPRVEAAAAVVDAGAGPAAPVGGSETILLVEDEDKVRVVVRDMLTLHGYTVLAAAAVGEAIVLSERHPGPIHLLVTDIVMPTMSGRQLAQRVAPLRPEMKVLYVSGYTNDTVVHHGVLEPDMAFLQKPFTVDGLMAKVREVLDG